MKTSVSYASFFSLTLITLALAIYPPLARAATVCDPGVAQIVSVQGTVEVRRAGQTQSQPARLNETYCSGDRIQVGDKSRADIALINQPVLRLDQNTVITLAGLKDQRASIIDLARGALHFFSRLPRNLEVNTAFVNAGVEGTEGYIEVAADRATITIFEGKVLAANAAGSLSLTDGQSAVAVQGQAPVLRTVVKPRDAVQWALYYPPVTYFRAANFQGGQPWQGMTRNSLEAYYKGDYQRAFDALKGAPADIPEPRFYAYRASLLLGVGRVDEAGPDLEHALKLNANYGDALALQSIIAVVQNDKEKALSIAQKAVSADAKSASALIALSYAQQANFNLDGARTSLQQAVQADPNNALAWARLAEIHLSFGELDDALEAAQKAVALNSNLSRTQMVLGFAYLVRVNTEEAKKAFETAIELDQADALSRLGLGLAKIREGDLAEGRRDLEIAASLDANNSIVRSYLGKAYYEEKRSDLAERDYATAKELDPKDPTPHFYDAIQKQTTNRPVEALQDMEKAIELNDNRAVYRSQLQLDADLAARSASQARIYSDLGFQQLALVEGWKSVNTDPGNFSAHRFLADSYSILPRHEIARVSEILQSQLLQPLNMTPIQPQLAEANLFRVSAGGPGGLSFNEFNPIFNRDGVTFQASGLGGSNQTGAGEGVLAGIYKKLSFSAGYNYFTTDGFRQNANQQDHLASVFLQLELSPTTSIQTEYRYRDTERGETRLRFFKNNFRPNLEQDEVTKVTRLGFRHAFSPDSQLIGNFSYQKLNDSEDDKPTPFTIPVPPFPFPFQATPVIDGDAAQRAYGGELQHLFRSKYINVVGGAGHFETRGKDTVTADLFLNSLPPLPPFALPPIRLLDTKVDRESRHTNVYLYSHLKFLENLTFTLGASGDFFAAKDTTATDKNQFNPKFGIVWNPGPSTTLRAAAFRTLKRTLITNQTIEPTQVAGFNQFFDDFNTTSAWRYGGAIDQKFSESLYGGAEFTFRDLEVPFFDTILGKTQIVSWKEYQPRAYLFWTPHKWVALRGEYLWEQLTRVTEFADGAKSVRTHSVPLGINFFHPSGLGASFKGTYVNQQGKFEPVTAARTFVKGEASFWTFDAAISYRFPNRYGFFTVGVTNLADRKFKYFDTDDNNARIQPDRFFFARLTLALP